MTLNSLLSVRDQFTLVAFVGVAAFALNWYTWPRARSTMLLAVAIASIILMVVGVTQWTPGVPQFSFSR
jgi:hypothetical protein